MEDKDFKRASDIVKTPEFQAWLQSRADLQENIELAANYFQQLIALKKFYLQNEDRILETFKVNKFLWSFSYPYDWSRILSPIEFEAWMAIRRKGKTILYPQYPVLNYHLDFANPGLKIGLELDGKAYHNPEKDKARDDNLRSAGWTIYRITGSEMMRNDFKDWSDLQETEEEEKPEILRHWILKTGDGVIEAIRLNHFVGFPEKVDRLYDQFIGYCLQTLEEHQSK